MTALYCPDDVAHWLRPDTCSHPECFDEDGGSNGCTHVLYDEDRDDQNFLDGHAHVEDDPTWSD